MKWALLLFIAVTNAKAFAQDCTDANLRAVVPPGSRTIALGFNSPRNFTWADPFVMNQALDQDRVPVPGILIPPPNATGKFPVVILVSSSYAYNTTNANYVSELGRRGIGSYVFDTYCPRGITSVKGNQAALHGVTTLSDAFRALQALSSRADVDSKRIGLSGWSRGGTVTIWAADRQVQERFAAPGTGFRSGVSIYGSCLQHFAKKNHSEMSLLIQSGEKDDWASAAQCRRVAAQMRSYNFDVFQHIYPDAYHAWDSGRPKTALSGETGYGTCDMIIDFPPLTITDETTHIQVVSWQDFANVLNICGVRAPVIAGNAEVARESLKEFGDFFEKTLTGRSPASVAKKSAAKAKKDNSK